MSARTRTGSWSLRLLLLLTLGGVGACLALEVAVGAMFVPRVSKLDRDTRQLVSEFEGFAAQTTRLSHALKTARSELASGDLKDVRATVATARAATPSSLSETGREALAGAPLPMRLALAQAIERESEIRDVLGREVAYLDLDRVGDAGRALDQASGLVAQLASTMSDAQEAGLKDVASRGEALQTLVKETTRPLLAISAFGVVLLVGLVVLFHRRLYLPLLALDEGLRAVSEGDLSARVEVRRDDEAGRLAALFNRMVEDLQTRESERVVEREQMTRRILDATLDAVITVDRQGSITSWNPGAESIFGWSATEAVGQPFDEMIFLPEERARQRARMERAFAEAGDDAPIQQVEISARRSDGQTFTAEFSVAPMVEAGETVALAGFVRDVTEQRRARERLRRSESLLRTVIDNLPAIVYMKDLEGRYTLVNRQWLELFGLDVEDVIGRRDVDVLPRAVVEEVHAGDRTALESRHGTQLETRVDLPGGVRHLVESRFPMLDAAGAPYALCGVASDVTEILELQDQVRRSQRLEAVGRLAGGIAHDFNNLVAVILGQSQLALEDAGNADVRAALEEIEGASKRAAALTSQLLAFARKQIVSTRVEDVNVLVRDTLDMVSRVIESNVLLIQDLDPDAGWVDVDPGQFSQVLLNLLVNAREAMAPAGGRVAIRTRSWAAQTLDKSLELAPGAYVRVTVADDGPGMSAEEVERAFEPFFSTKGQGTGLGLSTCHGIVKQAGGAITASNRPEGGVEIAIYLPRVEASEA